MNFIPPKALATAFTCPACGTVSQQNWWSHGINEVYLGNISSKDNVRGATCQTCGKTSIWIYDEMIYPSKRTAPFPNPDMPDEVLSLYNEANAICTKSPRGAAALLRLSIQVLCKHLGEPGKKIDNDIASLVKKGLPPMVQQALDIIRVTGNDAVHPGHIDTDDIETVMKLFDLVNLIVQFMISMPQQVSTLYNSLPQEKLAAIAKRDSPKS